jgi:hypothetical protein
LAFGGQHTVCDVDRGAFDARTADVDPEDLHASRLQRSYAARARTEPRRPDFIQASSPSLSPFSFRQIHWTLKTEN